MSEILLVKLIHPDAIFPTRATPEAAGIDLHAIDDCEILPNKTIKTPVGLCVEIPKGFCGKIFD